MAKVISISVEGMIEREKSSAGQLKALSYIIVGIYY